MHASIAGLYRHPVKGYTPERLDQAVLAAGACFPCDRLYAVENGPSGFDPAAPAHVSKSRFTVLARMAEVARAKTAYDAATGVFTATAEGLEPFSGDLRGEEGKGGLAAWLTRMLGDEATGPLRVIEGPGAHRFMDHPQGHVSIINLASVRDLEARIGRPVDPLRFRANLYVEGWAPWVENGWEGRGLMLGAARTTVYKPIVRCAATQVDPASAWRDMDVPAALFEHYGHTLCGIYVQVSDGGIVKDGDSVELLP
ncbi:MAG: MOSC domain-containing protein [Caulobacter sp.]|nr:MOSC domain-containing protein [Caulobacter sp.]